MNSIYCDHTIHPILHFKSTLLEGGGGGGWGGGGEGEAVLTLGHLPVTLVTDHSMTLKSQSDCIKLQERESEMNVSSYVLCISLDQFVLS